MPRVVFRLYWPVIWRMASLKEKPRTLTKKSMALPERLRHHLDDFCVAKRAHHSSNRARQSHLGVLGTVRIFRQSKSGMETATPSSSSRPEAVWPRRPELPFLLTIAAAVLVYALLPLGTVLEIGGDEGYELTKGILCSKGFVLYKDIWCDQPPLFPTLLGCVFRVFGPSLLVARLVAAGFGLLLLTVLYQLVRQRSSAWASVAAVFFLLSSPGVLFFSTSVMLEVPTIATALISAWLVFQWTKRQHWLWLVASGVMMGLALEIKFTAVLVLPPILAEIVLERWVRNGDAARQALSPYASPLGAAGLVRACMKAVLQFGSAAGTVFLAIAFMWGRGSLQSSWRSHTVVQHIPGLSSPEDFRFDPNLLLDHPECLIGAAIALIVLGRQGRWRGLAFPVVMLLTALAVHSIHRPWWSYYYLHLAVPLVWLSGLAFGEVPTDRVTTVLRPQSSSVILNLVEGVQRLCSGRVGPGSLRSAARSEHQAYSSRPKGN